MQDQAYNNMNSRISFLLLSMVYAIVFHLTYLNLVPNIFDFWGLSQNNVPEFYIFTSYIYAIIPAIWLPIKINKPSDLFCLILYAILYIPPLFVNYHLSKPYLFPDDALFLNSYLFIGVLIILYFNRMSIYKIKRRPISEKLFIQLLSIFSICMLVIILIILGAHAKYTLDFNDIFVIRAAIGEVAKNEFGGISKYATMWLCGFVLPLCFSLGVFCKNRFLVFFGLLLPIVLYGITAMKGTLFTPLYMTFVYILLRYKPNKFAFYFILSISVLLGVGILFANILTTQSSTLYISLVHFRTFSVPAQLIAQYYDFFTNNPVTYLSHVKGISSLIDYPYDTVLPYVIGSYYYDETDLGSNACFWAADGIAGFGINGILYISVLLGVLLRFLDSLASEFDVRFVALFCSYIVTIFYCVSIFTTLFSGGLLFVMFCLYVWPISGVLSVVYKKPEYSPNYTY